MIPYEIRKLGPGAVGTFLKALKEGNEKIPYCSLLIVGKSEVGKTSLVRQLLEKTHMTKLERTEGIRNDTVDIFDSCSVSTAESKWEEVTAKRREQFSTALACAYRGLQEGTVKKVDEHELLSQLSDVFYDDTQPVSEKSLHDAEDIVHPELPIVVSSSIPVTPPKTLPANKPPPVPVEPLDGNRSGTYNIEVETKLESWEASKFVWNKQPKEKVEPSVILNFLDFAGQDVYRPMHHCFISRQALYVVVFKLPDMLAYMGGDKKYNPFDDIYYWIHTIYAHICCKDQDCEALKKRVIIVGTHREDPNISENLKSIDNYIKKTYFNVHKNNRWYVDLVRIIFPPSFGCSYFIPVENTFDIATKKAAYLCESGTKDVKDNIKVMLNELKALKELRPIRWLKFEDYLCRARKSLPVVDMSWVRALARQCDITDKDDQVSVALDFFHLTGKVVYLSKLLPSTQNASFRESIGSHSIMGHNAHQQGCYTSRGEANHSIQISVNKSIVLLCKSQVADTDRKVLTRNEPCLPCLLTINLLGTRVQSSEKKMYL